MNERQRQRRPPAGPEGSWGGEALAEVLGAAGTPARDVALGDGVRFAVGDGARAKELEVYPGAACVRIEAPDARLELYRVAAPKIAAQSVVFESRGRGEPLRLSLSARGEVVLFRAPGPSLAAETPQQETEAEWAARPVAPAPATGDVVRANETEAAPQPRLTLSGRVGATPSFRTSPKGVLIARFPLAVRGDGDKTAWHTVLAFGERAARLRDSLQKGQAVEVVGYVHERDQRWRDGQTRRVQELYAVAVKLR